MRISKATTRQGRLFDYNMRVAELKHEQSYDYSKEREQEIKKYEAQIYWENRPMAFQAVNNGGYVR